MDYLDFINIIKKAKGKNKLSALSTYPELKRILEYTYNPFKRYYITEIEIFGVEGGQIIGDEGFSLLDDLANREYTGQAAFEKICDYICCLDYNEAEIFKMILKKDLRCGINIKTINKVFPGLIPETYNGEGKPSIMLLKNFDEKKVKFPVYVAVKKDGVRARFINGHLISRQGHKLIGFDHIEEELKKYNQEFDGELCVPGCNFDVASGLIRNNEPVLDAVYYIFDAPSLNANKIDRDCYLMSEVENTSCIKVIPNYVISNMKELNKHFEYSINRGEEGLVVYNPYSFYEDKRSYDWMRLVPLKTADCPVVDFFEGKGKHKNSLGGIIVDYNGKKVKVGTGFKEKIIDNNKSRKNNSNSINPYPSNIRREIWENKEQYLGLIAECEFKEETKAGSMRQPRFKRWRMDK